MNSGSYRSYKAAHIKMQKDIEMLKVKAYKSRYGKPLKLIKKYCVENITNQELANDIERLVWFKLLNSKKYRPVQKYAPSLQGRTDYLDDYPNYKG